MELHPLERKVLPALKKTPMLIEDLCKITGLSEVEVMRACQWLSNKGVAVIDKTEDEQVVLGKNGKKYLTSGLPEKQLFDELSGKDFTPISKIKLDKQEVNISIGILRRNNLLEIRKNKEMELKVKGNFPKILDKTSFLKQLPKERSELDKNELKEMLSRKDLIEVQTKKIIKIHKTTKADKIKVSKTEKLERLTPELLKNGKWKGKDFRAYDVKINVPKISGGRKHPLTAVLDLIREIYVEMGFEEMEGPWVETAFWCMDSMWIPQDHPARDVQDTFYLPYEGKLPEPKLIKAIKEVQEAGGKTGSKGYKVSWDENKAKGLLLRTHSTATTFRYLHKKNLKDKENAKYFSIGRIFRNEAIDATHLPEFHQAEGFVMQEGLTLEHLMGFIKEFYAKLGIHEIKFKLTYNPYTEPSLEALYYSKKHKKWIEMINSGLFRPESLAPYGINKPIIAWGIGIERLAMILYDLGKLKDLVGATVDIDWLKNYEVLVRKDEW